MNYFKTKRSVIHPEDQNDLAYWTRKLDVNVRQIYDAILETGSTRLEDVRYVLRKKKSQGTMSFWFHKFFKESLTVH